jgi:hypothetical protein
LLYRTWLRLDTSTETQKRSLPTLHNGPKLTEMIGHF